MAAPWRRALKYLLPHGLIEIPRDCRRLRELGRTMRTGDWWRSEWLMHEARTTGLDLLPAGHWAGLRTVVDVGANVGQWSSMVLDLIRPEQLIVLEPIPAAFAQLRERLGRHPAVQLHNLAVSDHEGTTNFHLTRDSTGASVLPPRAEMRDLIGSNWTVQEEITVPLTTLDQLLVRLTEVSLLKIDVQGLEEAVLAGAPATLRRTDFVLVELNYMPQYEGGSSLGAIHEILTRQHPFVLVDTSKPLRLNGRASMCDGLYVNLERLPDFAPREFV